MKLIYRDNELCVQCRHGETKSLKLLMAELLHKDMANLSASPNEEDEAVVNMRKATSKLRSIALKFEKPLPRVSGAWNTQVRKDSFTEKDLKALIKNAAADRRYGLRNKVLLLLMARAGLRACEVSKLCWEDVVFVEKLSHVINVDKTKSAYAPKDRKIPISDDLFEAMEKLWVLKKKPMMGPIIESERCIPMTAKSIVNWYSFMCNRLGIKNCGSISSRRLFATNNCTKSYIIDGSVLDVQGMMGHTYVGLTQRLSTQKPKTLKARHKLVNATVF